MSVGGISGASMATVAAAQTTPTTKTTTAEVAATTDTVTLSAEAKAARASGQPFFAVEGVEGVVEADNARVGSAERRAKRQEQVLKTRSVAIKDQVGSQLGRVADNKEAATDRIGGNVKAEQTRKFGVLADRTERLGGREQQVKARIETRLGGLEQKQGVRVVAVDSARLPFAAALSYGDAPEEALLRTETGVVLPLGHVDAVWLRHTHVDAKVWDLLDPAYAVAIKEQTVTALWDLLGCLDHALHVDRMQALQSVPGPVGQLRAARRAGLPLGPRPCRGAVHRPPDGRLRPGVRHRGPHCEARWRARVPRGQHHLVLRLPGGGHRAAHR